MKPPTMAFYALSADPITNGHLWVIEQASQMFDRVMVGVGQNPDKKYMFALDDRVLMARDAMAKAHLGNCEIRPMEKDDWTVKVADDLGYGYLIRGVRNARDFEYELELANFNRRLRPNIQTVLLPTPNHLSHVSSSFVKGLVGLKEWQSEVALLVPTMAMERLVHRSEGYD